MNYRVSMTTHENGSSSGHGYDICDCFDMQSALLVKTALEKLTVPECTVYGFDNKKRSFRVEFDITPAEDDE